MMLLAVLSSPPLCYATQPVQPNVKPEDPDPDAEDRWQQNTPLCSLPSFKSGKKKIVSHCVSHNTAPCSSRLDSDVFSKQTQLHFIHFQQRPGGGSTRIRCAETCSVCRGVLLDFRSCVSK